MSPLSKLPLVRRKGKGESNLEEERRKRKMKRNAFTQIWDASMCSRFRHFGL